MTNEEIVQKIQQTGDEGYTLTQKLVSKNHGLAVRIWHGYSKFVDAEEIPSTSFLACCDAVEQYDGSRGAVFATVYGWCLHKWYGQAMHNNMPIALSDSVLQLVREFCSVRGDFVKEHSREPTDAEIRAITGMSEHQMLAVKRAYNLQYVASLDAPVSDTDGQDTDMCLGDVIPSKENMEESVTQKAYNDHLSDTLTEIMHDSLSRDERNAVNIRAYQLSDYSVLIGQTRTEVTRNYNAGLRILRRPENARKLRGFMETENLYTGTGLQAFRRSGSGLPERLAVMHLQDYKFRDGDKNQNAIHDNG